MKRIFKNALAAALAVMMALPSMNAFAASPRAVAPAGYSISDTPALEDQGTKAPAGYSAPASSKAVEIDRWAASWARLENGAMLQGGSEEWFYLPLHSPESVKAAGSGTKITISAETTKMPKYVQIQYRTDKAFQKGVATKKIKNPKYDGKQELFEIKGTWNGSQSSEKYSALFVTARFNGSEGLSIIGRRSSAMQKKGLATKAAALKWIKLVSYAAISRERTKSHGKVHAVRHKKPEQVLCSHPRRL